MKNTLTSFLLGGALYLAGVGNYSAQAYGNKKPTNYNPAQEAIYVDRRQELTVAKKRDDSRNRYSNDKGARYNRENWGNYRNQCRVNNALRRS